MGEVTRKKSKLKVVMEAEPNDRRWSKANSDGVQRSRCLQQRLEKQEAGYSSQIVGTHDYMGNQQLTGVGYTKIFGASQ